MQNKPRRHRIKVGKFLFNILWCFRVMEKKLQGGGLRLLGPDGAIINRKKKQVQRVASSSSVVHEH